MNPALIWIDIIVVSFVIVVYILNQKGSANIPSSSLYLDGRAPKK
jgi:preprotein translocase subunit SecG